MEHFLEHNEQARDTFEQLKGGVRDRWRQMARDALGNLPTWADPSPRRSISPAAPDEDSTHTSAV
ncbi:hypothetical protein [Paraburkholderia adhaesiva]|uniref:hypothetical protein n=1 Tax=Paraburkholderia adhaesiva TaxID=2883244 RepID=UPI001F40DD0A|nr:hypothetical protein [Paraburkholderia adhaesiva]